MLRVIGDTHGLVSRGPNYREYLAPQAKAESRTYRSLIADVEHSVQVGDMGWRDDLEPFRDGTIDPSFHRIIYGNHDDYDNRLPHAYGDFGIAVHGGITFGYLRGEFSIDYQRRAHDGPNKSWWDQEELTLYQWEEALDFFENIGQVDLMITHGCPASLFNAEGIDGRTLVTNKWKLDPSNTAKGLDALFSILKVKTHIFGHHHNNWRYTNPVTGTNHICLNELCYVDIDENGNISETK